jgi:hypothetical protein
MSGTMRVITPAKIVLPGGRYNSTSSPIESVSSLLFFARKVLPLVEQNAPAWQLVQLSV